MANGKMARLMARVKSHRSSICVEIQSHGRAERLRKATLARAWNKGLHCELLAKIIL